MVETIKNDKRPTGVSLVVEDSPSLEVGDCEYVTFLSLSLVCWLVWTAGLSPSLIYICGVVLHVLTLTLQTRKHHRVKSPACPCLKPPKTTEKYSLTQLKKWHF